VSAADLAVNASAHGVEAVHEPVEAFVAALRPTPDVLIVDPPRTGMSRAALDGALRLRAGRVVYVSCDVATLARDSRRLVDAGYAIARADAFDLFPNTPHVETVVVFQRT
jgi:23S rRNA (uracil1939-C5)-methyltransferase